MLVVRLPIVQPVIKDKMALYEFLMEFLSLEEEVEELEKRNDLKTG